MPSSLVPIPKPAGYRRSIALSGEGTSPLMPAAILKLNTIVVLAPGRSGMSFTLSFAVSLARHVPGRQANAPVTIAMVSARYISVRFNLGCSVVQCSSGLYHQGIGFVAEDRAVESALSVCVVVASGA